MVGTGRGRRGCRCQSDTGGQRFRHQEQGICGEASALFSLCSSNRQVECSDDAVQEATGSGQQLAQRQRAEGRGTDCSGAETSCLGGGEAKLRAKIRHGEHSGRVEWWRRGGEESKLVTMAAWQPGWVVWPGPARSSEVQTFGAIVRPVGLRMRPSVG